MNILYTVIVLIFGLVGILMVLSGLPGTIVTWIGIFLTALINGFEVIDISLLIIFLGIIILGEVLEFVSGMLGAKKFGGSRKGSAGAIIGGLVGTVFFTTIAPGIGTLIGIIVGTFGGAFIGEYIEGKEVLKAGRAGWGAFLGRVAAMGIKILIILVMGAWALSRYFYI
ncbi:MAG: DUF456 domain-containing protein [Elusimicrobiota bacterium]